MNPHIFKNPIKCTPLLTIAQSYQQIIAFATLLLV